MSPAVTMSEIRYVKLVERALEVQFENNKEIRFEDCWLRDHCRCATCYHASTYQRAQHILDIPDVQVFEVQYDKTELKVTWDDYHVSTYKSEFLLQFDYKKWKESRRLKSVLWHGREVADKICRIKVDKFIDSDVGARSVFKSLVDYGIALIEGVEPTCAATELVCKALGGIQHTVFGGMWEFTTRADHADTAYTNLPLAAHNDNTYFTESAGRPYLLEKCFQQAAEIYMEKR